MIFQNVGSELLIADSDLLSHWIRIVISEISGSDPSPIFDFIRSKYSFIIVMSNYFYYAFNLPTTQKLLVLPGGT